MGRRGGSGFLSAKGWEILARNVNTPHGELDIVALAQKGVVFVEVKARSRGSVGLPEDAGTSQKGQHILDAAQFFLQEHPELDGDWRVDVVAVQGQLNSTDPQIVWFENAISGY
jgi:putative endonuclease